MARPISSKLYDTDDASFTKIVKEARSYADILRATSLPYKGGNINTVKRRIAALKLDDTHIPKGVGSNQHRKFEYRQTTLADAMKTKFVKGSNERTFTIKRLVLRFDLVPYKCECGNLGKWRGKELILQLDHKDGDATNNTLDNLRFLCPNCHCQTDTFAGKNCKK